MTSASDWTGRVGRTWAAEWARTDRSFAALTPHLDAAIAAAAPTGAFRALDIGCGAGATALALAQARPDGDVTGVDLSSELIAVALRRGGERGNLRFVTGDATAMAGDLSPVDLFVSRHGVMFFADPVAAFGRLRDAAAPGAALVFSCFGDPADNPWSSALVEEVTGTRPTRAPGYAPGPFGLADPAVATPILHDAGWRIAGRTRVDFRYVVGAGADPVADAVGFFRRIGPLAGALRDAPDPVLSIDRLKTVLARYCSGGTVAFPAAAWIWRAHARGDKP
ncbi:class I SAM-dependent methyltransferase [Sphingomonas sp. A2-49]|uniref:class I SAM-dependent methyltransferase n=1 Tax=Sphingomonas sp. A2-49 TaxID=1391375 RepID=UPI0021D090D8|nr:class I SAM-dependent methyltransferase [Sphingomonas sp. A2-49]MCU6452696.1 class I SAM-dependent methyltransferase [Sphingomonas sp. A2-49]